VGPEETIGVLGQILSVAVHGRRRSAPDANSSKFDENAEDGDVVTQGKRSQ